MNRKLITTTIILLAAAGMTSWLTIQSVKNKTNTHINKSHNPNAFMNNVTYTEMNKDGTPHNIIFIKSGKHFQANSASTFTKPNITIYNQKQNPWIITANSGNSINGTKLIHLLGNVKLHQAAGVHNKELTVTTTAATVLPKNKIVKTDQKVTILQPGTTVTATGAIANGKTKTLKLLSNVQETYVPN
ncbi:MAG: LPS export ABC transporter periplasmic protein LptC [Gammaproteobacteria bacterium]|nr:LPS export ABC transporter periplasmic protein LptC [Gammaproteobacteria bacterium]